MVGIVSSIGSLTSLFLRWTAVSVAGSTKHNWIKVTLTSSFVGSNTPSCSNLSDVSLDAGHSFFVGIN